MNTLLEIKRLKKTEGKLVKSIEKNEYDLDIYNKRLKIVRTRIKDILNNE